MNFDPFILERLKIEKWDHLKHQGQKKLIDNQAGYEVGYEAGLQDAVSFSYEEVKTLGKEYGESGNRLLTSFLDTKFYFLYEGKHSCAFESGWQDAVIKSCQELLSQLNN